MKKRGFTLIELLAVILILGIIALIAIPVVNNIIKESKRGAFETTAYNVVSAIEDACQLEVLKDEAITTTYTFIDGNISPTLNVKGKLPTDGVVTVNSSCNTSASLTNGTFTASKDTTSDTITVTDGDEVVTPIGNTVYANGTAVYFNPETGATCTSGEAVSATGTKTGCMKWYTFNDGGSSSDSINLILDHNTTALVGWNIINDSNVTGPSELLTQLQSDTSSWTGVTTRTDSYSVSNGTATYTINYSLYKARLITAAEIATITGNSSFVESINTDSSWFYLDSNNQTQTVTTIGDSDYKWLFDYTNGCTSYGCDIADTSNYGYWTSTAVPTLTSLAWTVYRAGSFDANNVHNASGVGLRPVITISKDNL